jgi:hypothetical protein
MDGKAKTLNDQIDSTLEKIMKAFLTVCSQKIL